MDGLNANLVIIVTTVFFRLKAIDCVLELVMIVFTKLYVNHENDFNISWSN